MSWGFVAAGTAVVVGGMIQSKSAKDAGKAQSSAAQAGISEEGRQFDAIQELFKPYIAAGEGALAGLQPYAEAGLPALKQQQALLGLGTPEEQQAAIQAIERGGLFQELVSQGEDALLQSASATGGLRGGNTQAALAQFRPQMLNQAINEQYGRLGGLTALGQMTTQNIANMGQASAARQATHGQQTAAQIGNLLTQQGQAQAGYDLAKGKIWGNMPTQLMGMYMGGGGGLFG